MTRHTEPAAARSRPLAPLPQPDPVQRVLSGAATGAGPITLPPCGGAYSFDPHTRRLSRDGVALEPRRER